MVFSCYVIDNFNKRELQIIHTLGYIPRPLNKVLIFKVKQSEEELESQVRGHLGILSGIANLTKHSQSPILAILGQNPLQHD